MAETKLLTAKEACAEAKREQEERFNQRVNYYIERCINYNGVCDGHHYYPGPDRDDVITDKKVIDKLQELGYKYKEYEIDYEETIRERAEKYFLGIISYSEYKYTPKTRKVKRFKVTACCEDSDNA